MTWDEEIRGAAAEESWRGDGGGARAAQPGGSSLGPLGCAGCAGWGRHMGAALAFASLPARNGCWMGGGAAAHPLGPCCGQEGASTMGPGPLCCTPAPHFHQLGMVCPLCSLVGELLVIKSPLPAKEPNPSPLPAAWPGSSYAQHRWLLRSCTQGCQGTL